MIGEPINTFPPASHCENVLLLFEGRLFRKYKTGKNLFYNTCIACDRGKVSCELNFENPRRTMACVDICHPDPMLVLGYRAMNKLKTTAITNPLVSSTILENSIRLELNQINYCMVSSTTYYPNVNCCLEIIGRVRRKMIPTSPTSRDTMPDIIPEFFTHTTVRNEQVNSLLYYDNYQ